MFGKYLRQLFGTTWGLAWSIGGAISTSVTFILIYWRHFALPFWIPIAISVAAWLIAPYRLYERQRNEFEKLSAKQQQPRRSELRVIEEPGSYFIRRAAPHSSPPRTQIGIYLQLSISIENKGQRPATIASYDLSIEGVGEFPDAHLSPQNYVWGLKAQHAVGNVKEVGPYVEVPAERLAANLFLPFMLDAILPSEIRQLRCKLTVRDTEGSTATGSLTLVDRG